jgi:pimeloyl-ACP methyl ester carboxylesterase
LVSSLHYEIRGDVKAPKILLLHELGGSHASWQWLDPYLENKFCRVLVDLPGAGESPLLSNDMSLDDVAASLVELLDQLEIKQINLAGVAYGAVVSAYLSANYPKRISSVMMIAIGSSISKTVSEYVYKRADQVEREGMEAVVDYSLKSSFPSGFVVQNPDIVSTYRQIFTGNNPHHYAVCSWSIADAGTTLTERLKSIRSRATVVGGRHDPSFTPEVIEEVANLLNPPVVPFILEEAGHFPQIQATQKLANLINSYFL